MQNYFWPPSGGGGSSSNPSVSTIGVTPPTSATLVGGINQISGFLEPIQLDTSNNLLVSATSLPLPSGAATASNQVTGNNSLATIVTNTTSIATAALQTTGNTSLSTIATNTTGVATASNQTTGNTSLSTIATNTSTMNNSLGSVAGGTAGTSSQLAGGVHNTSAPTLSTGQQAALQLDASGNLLTSTASLPLPTGAATSANQSTEIGYLSTIATNTTGASTAALQTTGNSTLTSILTQTGNTSVSTANIDTSTHTIASGYGTVSGSIPTDAVLVGVKNGSTMVALAEGQVTMSNSIPVTIASDQTAVYVKANNAALGSGGGSTSGTPNTSTQIFAQNLTRKYLLIQNLSSTDNIYINFNASASTSSFVLLPYGSLCMDGSFVTVDPVTVAATVASVPFMAVQV